MALYKYITDRETGLDSTRIVLRVLDNAMIPNDPKNIDWAIYQEWLRLGNIPDIAE